MVDYPSLAIGILLGASIAYMCVSWVITVASVKCRWDHPCSLSPSVCA